MKSSTSGSNKFDRIKFTAEVYNIVQEIPAGRVFTYGLIARLAGYPQHARLTGQILAQIPSSLQLPCHRVVNSQGRPTPHWPEQKKRLQQENIPLKPNGCVDLRQYLWPILQP